MRVQTSTWTTTEAEAGALEEYVWAERHEVEISNYELTKAKQEHRKINARKAGPLRPLDFGEVESEC